MKWIGQHIWDLTSRFRNDVYFEGLVETNETTGLVVDANGKVSVNRASGDEHATHVYENVRNDEGATIPAGTPVYSKGEIGGSERIKVGIAKASDPNRMPAIGITNSELAASGGGQDGIVTLMGVYNTNLTGFTGLNVNDIVYVAPDGGLTISKPAGTNLIQNVGIILKTNSTIIQGLEVTCIGRTNDIPNSLQLRKADGTDAGLISMTGNDMVLSNATGDVLIGSTTYQVGGDQDIFIGDGINSVDLVFEQSGAIKGYDSSVNLTIGGGGGTITFADPVNFVGGGINDEFQFNNLTIDGNFELSPITTTTSGGVLNGGFLNPAAEAKQVHMPQVLNDLAGFNHWGTVTVTGLYKTRTGSPGSYAYSNPVLPGDFANAFDGTSSTAGSWYSDNGASGTVQGEGVITLEWTNEATYGLWFGLVFGSDGFVPSRIKMEAYQTDVGWRTFADLTGVSSTDIGNIILRQIDGNSGTGAATNKLRFTLGSSISGSYLYFRIHTIYLANYAQGQNNLSGLGTDRTRGYHYLERYRPNYAWGHFNPGQTTTYNLGGSSYRWAIGYFNSLDVAQSLNIAGSISAGSSVGNLNVSAGIGQDLEYGSTAVTTLRFDSDRWRLYAGGTSAELMTLKENGNVGIGTTDPTSKLDVNGEIKSDKTANGVSFSSTGGGLTFTAFDVYTATNGGLLRLYNESTQTVNIDGRSSSGNTYFNNGGNVGIGTTSPTRLLQVVGSSATSGISTGTSTSPNSAELTANGTNYAAYLLGHSFLAFGTNHLNVGTAASEKMRITSAGNVGIGTTSPGATLDVKGTTTDNSAKAISAQNSSGTDLFYVRNDGVVSVNNGYLYAQHSSGAYFEGSIKARGGITDDGGTLGLGASGDTSQLNIVGGGNVGIGTTSPSSKLEVVSSGANGIVLGEDSNNSALSSRLFFVNGTAGQGVTLLNGAGNLQFLTSSTPNSTSGSEKMRITSSGNVGIATNSPSEKLEVNGNVQAGSYKISGVTVLSGSANVSLGSSGATGTISLNTHTSTALYVAGDDNVGIGTTSPSEKLEVNGKIKATDINFSGLPTSSAGLSSGDVWNDGGTLKIVS